MREGRHAEQRNFRRLTGDDTADLLADPGDRSTFECCKLDWDERRHHTQTLALHRDLFKLRADDTVFASQRADRIHGAVIASEALLLRYFGVDGDDRLLLINLGRDVVWQPASEPLLAPPTEYQWQMLWSSEDPRYGGLGTGAPRRLLLVCSRSYGVGLEIRASPGKLNRLRRTAALLCCRNLESHSLPWRKKLVQPEVDRNRNRVAILFGTRTR